MSEAFLADMQTFVTTLSRAQSMNPVLARMLDQTYDGVMGQTTLLKWLKGKGEKNNDNFIRWRRRKPPTEADFYTQATEIPSGLPSDPGNMSIDMTDIGRGIDYTWTDLKKCTSMDGFQRYLMELNEDCVDGIAVKLSKTIYGNGTTDVEGTALITGMPVIKGLQYVLTATPTSGIIYGQTRSSAAADVDIAHQYKSVTGTVNAVDAAAIQEVLSKCRKTKLMVTNKVLWNRLWQLAVAKNWPQVPIASMEKLDIGMPKYINFQGIPIVEDDYLTGTSDGGYISTTLKAMFFLNDDVRWYYDSRDNMKRWEPQLLEGGQVWRQRITSSHQMLMFDIRGIGLLVYTA